ncbi:MAG: ATP-binding cassette domain-containing protein [Treponema sp.]|jgi:NitT/TauT family transport system ATP-binding protein|nr:ATP-binding cassette domain-containing protein [Treponema sp.]
MVGAYLIRLEQVSKCYGTTDGSGTTQKKSSPPPYVLDAITLNIPQGAFHVFLGWSGCGKLTLINIIAEFVEKHQGGWLWTGRRLLNRVLSGESFFRTRIPRSFRGSRFGKM